jgi:hypothetical protein
MLVPVAVWAETVILQLHVLEGEGAVFAASSRALRPVTVRVTDETGAPIGGAAVSFRLPEEGVSGVFQNGLKTDISLSGPDGRAVAPNIAWGPLAGPARLRVTAALAEARAGVLVPVYVSGSDNVVVAGASAAGASLGATGSVMEPRQRFDPVPVPKLKPKGRWVKWVILAAGGVGAGALTMLNRKQSGGVSPPVAGPPISIGQPTISVGRIP